MAESQTNAKGAAIVVLVSGAAGQIGYALLPTIASGQMFGPDQEVIIHALEVPFPAVKTRLEGVAMEMQDCGYPLLKEFKMCFTDEPEEAWSGIDYAVLVGGFPRKRGMLRADLLKKNANIFKEAGECLEKYSPASAKILVVANPANTNCRVLAEYAPKIPKENFCALTRLDYNRSLGIISSREGVPTTLIKNMIIWGNHSKSQVPDVSYVEVDGKSLLDGCDADAKDYYTDPSEDKFMHTVQYRGASVIKMRGASSACSAANAAVCNIRDWHLGTGDSSVAMSVWSNGNSFGIADDLFYSFPCVCENGAWTRCKEFTPSEDVMALMVKSQEELLSEWAQIQEYFAELSSKSMEVEETA